MQKSRNSLQRLVLVSLFAALSIVFGKILKISIGDSIRLSFENLPIILSSFVLGPVFGGIVGGIADIIGCILVGYAINPIITLASILMGVIPYFAMLIAKELPNSAKYILSALITHAVCSMLIKSIGLHCFYATPFQVLILRVPIYIIIGTVEGYICSLLMKNKMFSNNLK